MVAENERIDKLEKERIEKLNLTEREMADSEKSKRLKKIQDKVEEKLDDSCRNRKFSSRISLLPGDKECERKMNE